MKPQNEELLDLLEDISPEFDEFELLESYEAAQEFIGNFVQTLDEFEYSQEITGCATYSLFLALIPRLLDMGYKTEDLIEEVQSGFADPDATIH